MFSSFVYAVLSGNYTEESFRGKTASNDIIIITVSFSASGEARLKNVTASTIQNTEE